MNNYYLLSYLIFVVILILHGIIEGFCENILRKKPSYRYDIDVLHQFANSEISGKDIIFSYPRDSGKTTYLLFKLIHHLQFNDSVVGLVKNSFHHRIILDMLKPICEDQGFIIKKCMNHESRLVFEYEDSRKILDFISENNNNALIGRERDEPIINLVDF